MNDFKALSRFWKKVSFSDDCWEWTGAKTYKGYGSFSRPGDHRNVPAHRFAYEVLRGPIPAGLVIDHLCRNRACVRPAHLEVVSTKENIRRGFISRYGIAPEDRTHCPAGHPYDEANTYRWPKGNRKCRACDRDNVRIRRAREREAQS